jgi:hypothetical protein
MAIFRAREGLVRLGGDGEASAQGCGIATIKTIEFLGQVSLSQRDARPAHSASRRSHSKSRKATSSKGATAADAD